MQQQRQNELELDDQWQHHIFDRLLAPILIEHTYRNQIVFIDIASPVASLLQRQAHVDAIAQTPTGGTLSIEIKIVRWPGAKINQPGYTHWKDLFLETWSCSIPGSEQRGWMATSEADYLLWCQCGLREDALDCWPFPFDRLREWARGCYQELPDRNVENIINGRALWTRGKLASIQKICRDLHVEGFRVNDVGLVSDFWGKPILNFLKTSLK